MNAHTEYQTILQDGKPAFVLVPAEEFERIRPLLALQQVRDGIPQAVVEVNILHDVPLIRAWREYLGLTQMQVAERAGMAQSALARIERGDGTPGATTLARIADAMGLSATQLQE